METTSMRTRIKSLDVKLNHRLYIEVDLSRCDLDRKSPWPIIEKRNFDRWFLDEFFR